MDALPPELIAELCSWLPKPTLKCFRLCCKAFAELGQASLFDNFEFRLWPRIQRLNEFESLTCCPGIASKLRLLSFESGILLEYADFRYWQAQVYKQISSDWAQSFAGRSATNNEYRAFHSGLHARFPPGMNRRYDAYRWYLDHEAGTVAQDMVEKLSHSLRNLTKHSPSLAYKIVMREPQVSLEDLEAFDTDLHEQHSTAEVDPRCRIADRRQNTLHHFINFLHTINISNMPLRELEMHDVPQELFTYMAIQDYVLGSSFHGLKSLTLKISAFPHSDWLSRGGTNPAYYRGRNVVAQRLRMLLDTATQLESLSLEFPQGKEADFSFDIFDQTNLDRVPRNFMGKLTSFELRHFNCSWSDLQALLSEATALSSLTLAHCRLETHSMIDLIRAIPEMKLKQVSLQGSWYVDEDFGVWHAHIADDFTDCTAVTSYEGPYIENGIKARIEKYMLVGGPDCPLPRWSPDGREEDIWEVMGDTSWHYLPGVLRGS